MQLLAMVGLTFAGGILLLWVCWKMYREIRHSPQPASLAAAVVRSDEQHAATMGFWGAITQIIVADVSVSLDNVLAVAGAAKGHIWVLVVGLAVAVVLMAVAASHIAKLLAHYPWITWIGLAIIFYVAVDMIWRGSHEIVCAYVPEQVCRQGLVSSFASLLNTSPGGQSSGS